MSERRARVRVAEVLNGRWQELDPDVRLGLSVVADQIDGLGDAVRSEISAAEARIAARLDLQDERARQLGDKLASIQRLLYTVGGTLLASMAGIITTLLTRGL